MIDQLKADPKRIPQPSRDDMMQMLKKSFDSLEIDVASRFKALWVTNALDGSEDFCFRKNNCISRKQNENISQ